MHVITKKILVVSATAFAIQANAQITFYEREDFLGRSFTTEQEVRNLQRFGFRERASSAVVYSDRWEVCEDARYRGRCVVLRRGSYPSLAAIGLQDRIASVHIIAPDVHIEDSRYAPPPVTSRQDYRQRRNERLFEADVVSVRAVVGPPEQHCWVEREAVSQPQSGVNIPATIAGAVIGGILGHQIGGGSGKNLATAGGAVAGGFAGAHLGRNTGSQTQTQDVQRCENVPSSAKAEFWDVTYHFRGQEHHVQMTAPPGRTITVNRDGEPRTR
jgi:uncharacterized protein YcfJ